MGISQWAIQLEASSFIDSVNEYENKIGCFFLKYVYACVHQIIYIYSIDVYT